MAYRLILDKNVEHDVLHRLDNYGHGVEHVDFVPRLGKGTDDYPIAQQSAACAKRPSAGPRSTHPPDASLTLIHRCTSR